MSEERFVITISEEGKIGVTLKMFKTSLNAMVTSLFLNGHLDRRGLCETSQYNIYLQIYNDLNPMSFLSV